VNYLRGAYFAAAEAWQEALELTRSMGDVPIGLEVLLRAANLWAQQDHDIAPLSEIFFIRQQPTLPGEARRMSEDVYHRCGRESRRQAEYACRRVDHFALTTGDSHSTVEPSARRTE
jgi:hypothetical protein